MMKELSLKIYKFRWKGGEKMRGLNKRVLCILVALAMLVSNLYAVPIANAEETQIQSDTTENVVYAENFDEYTGDNATTLMPVALNTKLSSGESVDYETGWIVKSNQTAKSSIELKNGAMYVNRTSESYDLIYRDGGQTWGNYTFEADVTYKADSGNWSTSTAPWFRLAFNIQENTDGTTKLMASAIVPETVSRPTVIRRMVPSALFATDSTSFVANLSIVSVFPAESCKET